MQFTSNTSFSFMLYSIHFRRRSRSFYMNDYRLSNEVTSIKAFLQIDTFHQKKRLIIFSDFCNQIFSRIQNFARSTELHHFQHIDQEKSSLIQIICIQKKSSSCSELFRSNYFTRKISYIFMANSLFTYVNLKMNRMSQKCFKQRRRETALRFVLHYSGLDPDYYFSLGFELFHIRRKQKTSKLQCLLRIVSETLYNLQRKDMT